jgi:hypothetical protein
MVIISRDVTCGWQVDGGNWYQSCENKAQRIMVACMYVRMGISTNLCQRRWGQRSLAKGIQGQSVWLPDYLGWFKLGMRCRSGTWGGGESLHKMDSRATIAYCQAYKPQYVWRSPKRPWYLGSNSQKENALASLWLWVQRVLVTQQKPSRVMVKCDFANFGLIELQIWPPGGPSWKINKVLLLLN